MPGFRKPQESRTETERRLKAIIEQEAEDWAEELQRTLALARSESIAMLGQEERRLAEDRRREFVERERRASAELSEHVVELQKRVEERLSGWAADLERAQQTLIDEIGRLEQRQGQLVAELETRIEADAERLLSEAQDQHALLGRLRQDLERAIAQTLETVRTELELQAGERRRALHEVGERLRNREREFAEKIEREQVDATRRLEVAVAEIERRQVEQLERSVGREAARIADAAALRFDETIKAAREEAAKRLARELDRAVSHFAREGERLLAEQLADLGEGGIQRLIRSYRLTGRGSSPNFPEEGSSTQERS